MSTPTRAVPETLFSVEALLRPVRDDAPAGDSLRYTAAWDAIVEARSSDAELPQGVWQREVERLCCAALQAKTKDLQIAVWLSEAWLYQRRLPGFLGGVQLVTGLHTDFFRAMYPTDPGQGALSLDTVEHRTNLIQTFNERLAFALKFVPLCEPPDTETLHAHTLADVEQAQYDDQVRRRMGLPVPEQRPLEAIEAAMAATPSVWLVQMDRQLADAEAATGALDRLLDHSYETQNGGLGDIQRTLEAMRLHLRPRLPEPPVPETLPAESIRVPFDTRPEDAGILSRVRQLFSVVNEPHEQQIGYDPVALQTEQMTPYDTPEQMAPSLVSSSQPGGASVIPNRAVAYERLREIADFLARTEPHSPVPFLLRRAIRWGSMDFGDLLPEMMRNSQGLEELNELLRLKSAD